MTAPAEKVMEVCDDCDGDGYIGILTDSRMGCMRCDETGFVEICSKCGGDDAEPDLEGVCVACYRDEICGECGGVGYTLDHSDCTGWMAACDTISCETCDGEPHPDARGRFMIWESDSPHAAPAGVLR